MKCSQYRHRKHLRIFTKIFIYVYVLYNLLNNQDKNAFKLILTFFFFTKNYSVLVWLFVVQLLSHVQLSNPMDCSTPGFPVLHNLLKFAQTHVH